MTTVNYPDGSIFTTNGQNQDDVETKFQLLTAQLLGILISPLNLKITLTSGLSAAVVDSSNLLYPGVSITGTGIPDGTTLLSVTGLNVVLSANATSTGQEDAVAQDLNAPKVVRIGWQQQGQPGPDINKDTVAIIAQPIDTPYSRIRDGVYEGSADVIFYTDTFTRTWQVKWIFYGPNSLTNALLVKSPITTVGYVDTFLADINFLVNPDIEEPGRNPELFQGQWWERVDLKVEFNEQITETLTVGTVGSVEVLVYTKDGKLADFPITT